MKTITLPGLIDPHVHLRDPGQTHKEDFYTGTSAALAGGYTTIIDMPNNLVPITTKELLDEKIANAQQKTVCDLGFHFGTLADNFDQFELIKDNVMGLKIYMNITTGGYKIDSAKLIDIYKAWPTNKPIMLHAEDDVSDIVLKTLKTVPKQTHMCHVSNQKELEFVLKAKEAGLPITCGVTPHHLFLTENDVFGLGPFANMKPYLKPKKDQQFLWDHLDGVDIIESDHAPHGKERKQGLLPPFGVPGLETTLPLMLTAQAEGKLSMDKLVSLLHDRSSELFNIPYDKATNITVSLEEFEIDNNNLFTKCGWSPFNKWHVIGKVINVKLCGKNVYKNNKILAKAGSGKIIN